MRYKKTREVNIFSASVVDLFASGLGVFLIVAIIALVNQKKEHSKANSAETQKADAKIIDALEVEVSELSKEIKAMREKNLLLQTSGDKEREEMITSKLKVEASLEKQQLEKEYGQVIKTQKEELESLKEKSDKNQQMVAELEKKLATMKEMYVQAQRSTLKNSTGLKQKSFEVGTKIQLNNVQFYAGTQKTIEPYATEEIRGLAKLLLENPKMRVEVSGHIFLSKEELEKGTNYDSSNLSERRANAVCDKLVALGVPGNRLKCVGYGGKRYLYLTDDEYSREAQLNRRVEVEVLAK